MRKIILAVVVMAVLTSSLKLQAAGGWGAQTRVTNNSQSDFFPTFDTNGDLWWWRSNDPGDQLHGNIVREGVIEALPGNGLVAIAAWGVWDGHVGYVAYDLTASTGTLTAYYDGNVLATNVPNLNPNGYQAFYGLGFGAGGSFALIGLSGEPAINLINDDTSTQSLPVDPFPNDVAGVHGGQTLIARNDSLGTNPVIVTVADSVITTVPLGSIFSAKIVGDKMLAHGQNTVSGRLEIHLYDFVSDQWEMVSNPSQSVSYYDLDASGNMVWNAWDGVTDRIYARIGGINTNPINMTVPGIGGVAVRGDKIAWSEWHDANGFGEIHTAIWFANNSVGDEWNLYE